MHLLTLLLVLMFALVIAYFCYCVYFYGGRWVANPYNPRISSRKRHVVMGTLTDRDGTVLKEGDCVLFDMGCVKDRYCSDMTRTWFCGQPTEKQVAVHDLVRRANEAAEALIKPGVRLCDLDAAARDLIAEAGYGEYFNHRLGHFIGQTDHEKGDVSSANTAVAKPGMIFSIEPGIYLPGEFGVRVEDLVLVTEDGCEVLNHYPHELRVHPF